MSTSKLAAVLEMIENAQASLRSAKALLSDISGVPLSSSGLSSGAGAASAGRALPMPAEPGGKVIEGMFDGQNMIGPDKRTYPVPANYASKSKLVHGDILKLTITDSGSFIYKQIGPIPRRTIVGTVTFEDGVYKIVAEGDVYRVLMASVTFYKAEVGQRVSILLPEGMDAEWATIDNMLPDVPPGMELEDDLDAARGEEADAPSEPESDDSDAAPKKPATRKRKAKD